MPRKTNAEKERSGGGRSSSKAVKEFSQVEDFGRDIKVETDADASSSTSTAAVGAVFTGASAAATAGPPLPQPPPPPPTAPHAAALRPKQLPPNSDLPTSSQYHHQNLYQQQQQPYSPRQPYEPYYNTFVDDSSNRHIIIHNDDPERPTTVATVQPPPTHQPRLPPFSQRWHTIKRILTLLSMTWSIVILVLSCLFAVRGGLADGVGLWSLPITIAALLFNTAELLTYCIRRTTTGIRRGMHPGAHVGGHLLLWLTCALAVYLGASVYTDVLDARRDCNAVAAEFAAAATTTDGDSEALPEGLLRGHCNNNYHYASNLSLYREGFYVPGLQTLLAMFVLATVTHFALFVRACVEVDQRNQLRFGSNDAYEDDEDDEDQPAALRYRSRRFSRRGGRGGDLSSTAGFSYYDVAVINEEEGRAPMPARKINARPPRDGPEMAQRPKPYA